MVGKIIKAVGFCLIFVLVLLTVQNRFVPFEEQDTNQAKSFYNDIEKDSVDVLVIGASTVLVGVSPLRLYEKSGIVSHVRGNSRQSAQVMWLDTKDSLKTQKPKVVIYNGHMLLNSIDFDKEEAWARRGLDYLKMSKEKIQTAKYITDHSKWQTLSSYIFPILRYHTRWTEVTNGCKLQPPEAGEYDFYHGQYAVYRTEPIVNKRRENLAINKPFKINKTSFEWYKKSVDVCKDNGIQVLMVVTQDMRWTEGKHRAIAKACKKLNVPLIDFNSEKMDRVLGTNWSTDFYNDHHLNVKGSIKFTDYLGKVLEKNYHISSKPSEKVSEQFEKDISRFKKTLKHDF